MSTTSKIENWPVIWRVVSPAAGSYDHDMVFLETENEADASKEYRSLRCGGWPVRIEQVRCGPLPDGYSDSLNEIRSLNAQNAGTKMRAIPGAWSK
jgi:hypothetical protein